MGDFDWTEAELEDDTEYRDDVDGEEEIEESDDFDDDLEDSAGLTF